MKQGDEDKIREGHLERRFSENPTVLSKGKETRHRVEPFHTAADK